VIRGLEFPATVKIDLHGYHPSDIVGSPMAQIIGQAWEMGADTKRSSSP
jgi:hypothetical protein